MGGFLAALLPTFLSGLLGGSSGGGNAPNSSFGPATSIGDGSVTSGLIGAGDASTQPNLGGVLSQAVGSLIGNATFGRWNAKIAGSNQLAYNRSAYPGTPDWQTLSTGSAGASAGQMFSPELVQRERESKRSASVALQTSRMSATAALAGEALRDAGPLNAKYVEMLLRAGGLLPAGAPFDAGLMVPGRVSAEIDRTQQETRRSSTLLPADLDLTREQASSTAASAANTRMDTYLKPYRFALDEWKARYGDSYAANELAGLTSFVDQHLSDAFGDGSVTSGAFMADLMRQVNREFPNVGEGDLYALFELFSEVP